MTRAHFVKSARKDNSVAKRGESYYWWKFRRSGKHFSKTPPLPSQLTQSDFWSAFYAIGENSSMSPSTIGDVESGIETIKGDLENLRDDTQGKLDNMPQGLQEGDTGQLLQERIEAVEEIISALDGVDMSWDGEAEDSDEENRASEIWDEVTEALGDISCS